MRIKLFPIATCLFVLTACFLTNVAVTQAEDAKPKPPTIEVKAPTVPAEQQVKIKESQLQLTEAVIEEKQLQDRFNQIEAQRQKIATEVTKELEALQAGHDKAKWLLNPRTLVFEPVEEPSNKKGK